MYQGMAPPARSDSCPLFMFNQNMDETRPFNDRKPKLQVWMRQQHPLTFELSHSTPSDAKTLNWISVKLVSNIPLNSLTTITIHDIKGSNFTEAPLATATSGEFTLSQDLGSDDLKIHVKPNRDMPNQGLNQGQRIWPGQYYHVHFQSRNHFPQEMLSGATRPAHATGAETRVATSVGIGSA